MKSFPKPIIFLHWFMAATLIVMLVTGEQTIGGHGSRFLPSLHASMGLILFLLLCLRLFWRLKYVPPLPLVHSRIETVLARVAHFFLYVAMFLIPLTGWLAYTKHVKLSFGVRPASWFGLKIPLLPDFGINWHLIHNWGGKFFLALIVLHALVALKHHFIDRDDTLKRMLR